MLRHTYRSSALAALAAVAARLQASMVVGTVIPAKSIKLSVALLAAPTVFLPVSFQNSFDHSSEENIGEFEVFDFPDPITMDGNPRRSMSFSGYLAQSDDGQDGLLAAAAAGENVILKVLWDGTNGYTQECKVRSYRVGARAGNNPADVAFDFTPTTAAATVVGTGPLP